MAFVSLLSIVAGAFAMIGIMAFLVQRDFFLPKIFFRESMRGRQFLAATWVLAVTGSTILVLIAALPWTVHGVGWALSQFSANQQGPPASESAALSLRNIWKHMGLPARSAVIILFIGLVWTLAVMIDRFLYFAVDRKQTREVASKVAAALKYNKLDEAISIAEKNQRSHIAKVVATGLAEFQAASAQVPEGEGIEAAKRALERSVANVHAEMKRGLGGLATIGAIAPFVGLFGTVLGIIHALQGIQAQKAIGLSTMAGGFAEALVTTALGLLVAVPAIFAFNYFNGRVQSCDKEMETSSRELVDYFSSQRSKS